MWLKSFTLLLTRRASMHFYLGLFVIYILQQCFLWFISFPDHTRNKVYLSFFFPPAQFPRLSLRPTFFLQWLILNLCETCNFFPGELKRFSNRGIKQIEQLPCSQLPSFPWILPVLGEEYTCPVLSPYVLLRDIVNIDFNWYLIGW